MSLILKENGVYIEKIRRQILVVSRIGCANGMTFDMARDGNKIFFSLTSHKERKYQADVFDDVKNIEKIKGWYGKVSEVDLIVFDDVGFGSEQDSLRKNYPVVGGSSFGDKLELDRMSGLRYMEKKGMKVPEYYEFHNWDDAIEFVKKEKRRFVLKPCGMSQDVKELTYSGKKDDGSDMIFWIEHMKERFGKRPMEFILQEFVEGIEVAVDVWCDGEKFLMPIGINFEHKPFFPGDIGFNTGEMGTVYLHTYDKLKLYEEVLKPCEEDFVKDNYVGNIDVNCIVNEEGAFPLEFTNRFGYPAISIQTRALKVGLGDFLYDLAHKNLDEAPFRTDEWQLGIVVSIPPSPFWSPDIWERLSSGLPIIGFDYNNKYISWYDVKYDAENKKWRVAGTTGYVAVVCGVGSTIEEAQKMALENIKTFYIPNMYYRNDIGNRVIKALPKLKELGYL